LSVLSAMSTSTRSMLAWAASIAASVAHLLGG
jgi:hypothetical protein